MKVSEIRESMLRQWEDELYDWKLQSENLQKKILIYLKPKIKELKSLLDNIQDRKTFIADEKAQIDSLKKKEVQGK